MPESMADFPQMFSSKNEVVENVKVIVRCRPLSGQERQQNHRSIVDCDAQSQSILVANPSARDKQNEPLKCYSFDHIFGPNSNQIEIYNIVSRPIVENVLRGFNGTIFAYGQTGTGKTYTMSGNPEQNIFGIIQYSFAHIFDQIAKSGHEKKFLVRISYMEIYNEEVRDLLARPPAAAHHSLEIKERQDIGVYVKDLLNVTASNADQCMRIMEFGNANRQTGRTAMNEESSRSHAIFTITIECSETMHSNSIIDDFGSENEGMNEFGPSLEEEEGQKPKGDRQMLTQGKLSFVDLAGSERQSKTHSQGERLKEATKINLSLSTLGNVISALADQGAHIPYRNSKLTRILSDSLGGNSKTCMIANIGPADYNYEETISTLRYASRAKRIQNVARINQDPKDALLRRFQEEIELLKKQLEENAEAISDAENGNNSDGDAQNDEIGVNKNIGAERRQSLSRRDTIGNVLNENEELLAMPQDESERRRLAEALLKREEELRRNRTERDKLAQKLMAIERQIIVGGENMLEKVEAQNELLEASNQDLERAIQSEQQLNERYRSQQAEHLEIEEKNATMQEQAQIMGKRLKKVWTQYMQAKGELHDQEMEHHRETEALLESVRQLQREILFANLLLEESVPEEQQKYIEKFVHWNEEIGDWQLKCIAYTGNNLRQNHHQIHGNSQGKMVENPQLQPLFMSYADLIGNNFADGPNDFQNQPSSSSSKAKEKEAARIRRIFE